MMGYKDKTFCTEIQCLEFDNCSLALTSKVHRDATDWFGSEKYPITMFAGRVSCYTGPDVPFNPSSLGKRH